MDQTIQAESSSSSFLRPRFECDVDDFSLAGTLEFVEKVIKGVSEKLTISKVENGKFRFTGLDLLKQKNIVLLMESQGYQDDQKDRQR